MLQVTNSYSLVKLFKTTWYIIFFLQIAKIVAQFWSETMRSLADKLVLPLNVSRYAITLHEYVMTLDDEHGTVMRQHGMSLGKYNCLFSLPRTNHCAVQLPLLQTLLYASYSC